MPLYARGNVGQCRKGTYTTLSPISPAQSNRIANAGPSATSRSCWSRPCSCTTASSAPQWGTETQAHGTTLHPLHHVHTHERRMRMGWRAPTAVCAKRARGWTATWETTPCFPFCPLPARANGMQRRWFPDSGMYQKRSVNGGKEGPQGWAGMQVARHTSPYTCRICHANGIHAWMLPVQCGRAKPRATNWGPQWEAPHVSFLTTPIQSSSRQALSFRISHHRPIIICHCLPELGSHFYLHVLIHFLSQEWESIRAHPRVGVLQGADRTCGRHWSLAKWLRVYVRLHGSDEST